MRLDLKSYFLRKIMISTSASQTRTRLISSLFSQFRDDGVSILSALATVSLMLLLVGKHWTDMVVSNFPLFCFSIFNIRFWAMRSSPGTGAGAPSTGLCVLWKDTINKFCRNHQNHQDFSNFWVYFMHFPYHRWFACYISWSYTEIQNTQLLRSGFYDLGLTRRGYNLSFWWWVGGLHEVGARATYHNPIQRNAWVMETLVLVKKNASISGVWMHLCGQTAHRSCTIQRPSHVSFSCLNSYFSFQ